MVKTVLLIILLAILFVIVMHLFSICILDIIDKMIVNMEDKAEEIEPKETCEGCVNWYRYSDGVHYCVLNNETQCFENDFRLKEYKW